MTYILEVSGGDEFSAMTFEDQYDRKTQIELIRKMLKYDKYHIDASDISSFLKGDTYVEDKSDSESSEASDEELKGIDVYLSRYDKIDKGFISYVRDTIQSYDDTKAKNFFDFTYTEILDKHIVHVVDRIYKIGVVCYIKYSGIECRITYKTVIIPNIYTIRKRYIITLHVPPLRDDLIITLLPKLKNVNSILFVDFPKSHIYLLEMYNKGKMLIFLYNNKKMR